MQARCLRAAWSARPPAGSHLQGLMGLQTAAERASGAGSDLKDPPVQRGCWLVVLAQPSLTPSDASVFPAEQWWEAGWRANQPGCQLQAAGNEGPSGRLRGQHVQALRTGAQGKGWLECCEMQRGWLLQPQMRKVREWDWLLPPCHASWGQAWQ